MDQKFEDVFRAEFPQLYRFVFRRVGNSAAEDIAAETFAIAYRRWDERDSEKPPRPWLYGIATNVLRHHWRRERRMLRTYTHIPVGPVDLEVDDEVLDEQLDATAQRSALASALADMRPAEREVLLLHAWAEMSDVEIAQALELPPGTVKSRLHRAREALRNQIGPSGQVVEDRRAATEETPR